MGVANGRFSAIRLAGTVLNSSWTQRLRSACPRVYSYKDREVPPATGVLRKSCSHAFSSRLPRAGKDSEVGAAVCLLLRARNSSPPGPNVDTQGFISFSSVPAVYLESSLCSRGKSKPRAKVHALPTLSPPVCIWAVFTPSQLSLH